MRTGISMFLSVVRPPGSWIEIVIDGLQRQRRIGQIADRTRRFRHACGVGLGNVHRDVDGLGICRRPGRIDNP